MKSFFISILIFFSLILSKLYGLDVTGIIAFGDSLTCNGNACKYSKRPATICYAYPETLFEGRFTDGSVWIEVFADKLGLPRPIPSLAGGFNFAYGGATTGWEKSLNLLNVGDQVEHYLKRAKGRADSQKLFVLWAGGNDIKNFNSVNLVSNIEQHITRLAEMGAKTFLIPNFPPLQQTRVAAGALYYSSMGLGKLGSKIGRYFELIDDEVAFEESFQKAFTSFADKGADRRIKNLNKKLESMLRKIERSLKIKIYRLDAYTHFYAVRDNLEAFGLGEEDLFIHDGFHPSALVHALIAEEAFNVCK